MICVAIMGALGVLFGIGLALASKFFHVVVDPRIEHVNDALPGVNCGACGYAGCEAYAEAVVKSGAAVNLCIPGAHETALNVAHIMGLNLDDEQQAVRSIIHCQGAPDRCRTRYDYDGIEDCRAAQLLQAGPKACDYGCLGFGTCVRVCPFGAITMGEDRIPIVNWDLCTGCGKCVRSCPRNLIETVPITAKTHISCSSQDKGKAVKAVCETGCIKCMLCKKVSSEGAVIFKDGKPTLTYPPGEDYAKAIEK